MDDLFTTQQPDTRPGTSPDARPQTVPTPDQAYREVMHGLSPDQRRAVTHEGGPLIVLAGPGTGKTRVITARVAHMIRERGIEPDRIAAVTFTNKAAGELQQRLAGLVGDTVAARVQASTFHSLGYAIVRRFGDVLGLPSNPQIIDSAQRNRLIRELIRERGLYRDALGTGIGSAVEHAQRTMDALRHLGMDSASAADWLGRARGAIDTLDEGDRDARRAELDRFADAASVYAGFEDACRARGWVVIDDLIMLPTRLVRQHPPIASILRHDFRHFVVDEFQDVNRAQIELIRALCPPGGTGGGADVCVVGDDDQSIYGFRGADDRAFAHFAAIWPAAETVQLSTNYRSASVVVDAGNATITRASSRFAPDKRAAAHRGDVPGSSVELVRLEEDAQIGEAIASMLLKMADEGGGAFSFSRCAVIARTNPFLEQIARTLQLEGIPIDMREKPSPMQDAGALDVLAWARLLVDPDSSADLRRVLLRPPYSCDAVALGSLIQGYRASRSRFEHTGADSDTPDPGTLIDWVCARGDDTLRTKSEAMRALLGELARVAGERPAAETLLEIIKRTGVVHRELGDARSRARRIESISALVRFARSRADRFDAPGDLGAMLAYFDDLDEKDRSLGELPEEYVTPASTDAPTAGDDRGAVALITAHSAKGLEFDTVIIPRVGQHGFPQTNRGDDGVLPTGVEDRSDDPRDDSARHADEERRVFFVALTRAERRAVLMSKLPKRPTAANYALELRDELGERLVERDVGEVIDPQRAGDAVSRLSAEFKAVARVRDAFDQAKREARRDAASAIDAHEIGEIPRHQMLERLNAAADRAAAAHEVLRTGEMPAWAADPQTRALAAKLLETLEHEDVPSGPTPIYPGLTAPLRLSFSQISKYRHCPRCYLVEHVLRLPLEDQIHAVVGTAVHEALERFYGRWRDADAEGRPTPGYEELQREARARFIAHWPRDRAIDEATGEQLGAMMRLFWDRMHRDDAHIEELEKSIRMPYVCEGLTHTLTAKIDRVDAGEHGGRRVIDYKTGAARKDLVEPKKTDLQLGIYAMAIEHELGDPGPGSVCEYWCLQDGSRGVIGFDALDMKKIRNAIDQTIQGMLAGDWSRGSKCTREDAPCTILDAPGVDISAIADG